MARAPERPRRTAPVPGPMEIDPARATLLEEDWEADRAGGVDRMRPSIIDERSLPASLPEPARAPRRRWRFGTWVAAGLGGLVALSLGLDTAGLIARAAAIDPILGAAALAALLLALAGAIGVVGQEYRAFARLRIVDGLRKTSSDLVAADGHGGFSAWHAALASLYRGRPDLAGALDTLERRVADGGDALEDRELVRLAEREVLDGIDRRAYGLVLRGARDTAIATALSPAALLDVLLVLWRNAKLVRDVATLYGARPGWVGSLTLLRRMLENLAVAGVAESGDGLLVDAVGGGLAAALSQRVGQGVFNGLLTARIGLTAMHLCRPMPFAPERRPSLTEIRRSLLSAVGSSPDPARRR